MKHSYYIIPVFMLASLVSCYRDEPALVSDSRNDDPLTGARGILGHDEYSKNITFNDRFKISSERAARLALEYVSDFENEEQALQGVMTMSSSMSSSASARTVRSVVSLTDDSALGMVAYSLDASESVLPDTLVHIVNFMNDEGFAVISGDLRDGVLLAYSGEGNLNLADTIDNQGLALHVDMILNHEKVKRERIQEAEAQGLDYFGDMEITVMDEEGAVLFASGLSGGSGLPGGGSGGNDPGLPGGGGLPGSSINCARYPKKTWSGNEDAIANAKRKAPNGCYGNIVQPPQINFQTGPAGVPGVDPPPCQSTPYCSPPVYNWDGYYRDYGCVLKTEGSTIINYPSTDKMLKTAWDQYEPLNSYCPAGTPTGCAALALLQIYAYFKSPQHTSFKVNGSWVPVSPFMDIDNVKYKYNDTLARYDMNRANYLASYVRQIGRVIGQVYTVWGTAATGLVNGPDCIFEALEWSGYEYGYGGMMNYENPVYFPYVKESLLNGKPIFIYGFPRAKDGTSTILWLKGHCWVLSGYKEYAAKYVYEDFYFDEWGKLNKVVRTESGSLSYTREYVCANMGWGRSELWVLRGVYDQWSGESYKGYIKFIAGIKPKNMSDNEVKARLKR